MKKFLSVLMAILMLGSALMIGVSAESTTFSGESTQKVYNGYTIKSDEVLVVLQFADCKSINKILVRNFSTGVDEYTEATGEVAMIVKTGATYALPAVTAPSGQAFAAWVDVDSGDSYGVGSHKVTDADCGKMVQYRCQTTPAVAEKDTMETIKTILVKVFGILIGLFYGDTDYGQELVASFFNSVFGAL